MLKILKTKITFVEILVIGAIAVIILTLLVGGVVHVMTDETSKTVIAKETVIEGHYEYPQTVHYLIAEDGSLLKVSLGEYHKAQLEETVKGKWKQ